MGRMAKTRAAYRLAQNNTKAEDTSLEEALEDIFPGLLEKVEPIECKEGSETWMIRPDRRIKGTNVLLEADGGYHESRRETQKSHWRDGLLLARGYRIVHIPRQLLETQAYYGYVKQVVLSFVKGSRLVERMSP